MAKHFWILTTIGVLTVAIAVAADAQQKSSLKSSARPIADEDLKSVARVLEPVFEKLDPKALAEFPKHSASYEVRFRTQSFKIHAVGKSGVISEQPHDEIGPSHDGFLLRVLLQRKGEVNQAVTPQTRREPYWTTDLNVTPLANSDQQIYWALSYGCRTDENLLKGIRNSIKTLEE